MLPAAPRALLLSGANGPGAGPAVVPPARNAVTASPCPEWRRPPPTPPPHAPHGPHRPPRAPHGTCTGPTRTWAPQAQGAGAADLPSSAVSILSGGAAVTQPRGSSGRGRSLPAGAGKGKGRGGRRRERSRARAGRGVATVVGRGPLGLCPEGCAAGEAETLEGAEL
ncbi:unnamed protein product [Rangifer tarandus platyrhynchus]|uniref:Uncharacterized protein n=1 Tax=Rangifer tarandus platyrhynchus TaxID=3082113 RepID=A0ABN8Y9V4_RANTA|nr:unnamed protein product [Rangifer tarandus platyrhynchus]